MEYENQKKEKEDEIDAMEVAEDWPLSQGEWICKETIVGCFKCQFRTRNPAKTGHFKVTIISPEQ